MFYRKIEIDLHLKNRQKNEQKGKKNIEISNAYQWMKIDIYISTSIYVMKQNNGAMTLIFNNIHEVAGYTTCSLCMSTHFMYSH